MTTLTLGPALEGLYDFAKGYDYTARLDAYKAKFQDILAFADNVGGQLTLSSITAQKIVLQSGSHRVEFTGAFAFTSTTPAQLLEDIKQGPNGTVTGVELYNGATRLAAATVSADTITITAQDETLTVRGQFANSFASVRPFWDKSAINDAFQIDSLVLTTAGSETARLDFATGAASLAVEGYRVAITGTLANALPGPAGRSLQQVVAAVDLGTYNVSELVVTKANGDLVGTLSNSGSPLTAAQAIEGLRSVGTRLTQGSDRLDLGGLSQGIVIDLATGQTTYRTLSGPLPYTQAVEAVAGTAQADRITGNALDNDLSAGAGADTVYGGDGNDVLYGQTGNDLLSGDNGADTLYGNAGDDVLHGGAGADWLRGGLGNDTFFAADGDTIGDLEDGETIQVAASVTQVTVTPGATTTLAYDSDGNGSADATITLTGQYSGTFTTAASGGGTAITYHAPPPPPPSSDGGGGGGGGGDSGGGGGGGGGSTTPPVTAPVIPHETVTIPAVQPTGPDQTSTSVPLVTDETGQPSLQASVPAGVGMQVESYGTASGIDGLLTALQRRVDPDDPDQSVMTVAGNTFAAQLPPGAELTVRTIVPTAPTLTSAPTQPIVITGQTGTAAGGTGLKQEAVVIDASNLPSGTVIQLQDIEFAAIVGAVRVTGGSGSQNLVADGSAQYIVLGADDDTLHGGGGDDFIGSEEGDDQLFGGDGLDTVTGGIGNDMLYGNRQADVLYGNQGVDRLFGGQDTDTLFGGRDGDALYGNLGGDALFGNEGADWLFGGQGDDGLYGGQGNDALLGNLGADALFGNAGNDTLLGNAGWDTLAGGDGADVYRFDRPADGGDVVTDFQAGVDKIAVVGPNFGSIPAGTLTAQHFALDNPASANAQFVFSTATGVLSFDADGSGAGAAVTIATLNVRTLSASDIVVLAVA